MDEIITTLEEAISILTKEIPLPDMDVSEWNQTPLGRAVNRIGDAIEMLVDIRDDHP